MKLFTGIFLLALVFCAISAASSEREKRSFFSKLKHHINKVKKHQHDLLDKIKHHGKHIKHKIHNKVDDVKHNIHNKVDDVKHKIHNKLDDVKHNIHNKVDDVKGKIHNKLDDVKGKIHNKADDVQHKIHNKMDDVKHKIHNKLDDVKGKIHNKLDDVKGKIHNKVDDVQHTIHNKMDDVKHKIHNKLDDVKDNIHNKLDDVKDNIHNKVDDVKHKIHNKVDDVKDNIHNKVDDVKHKIHNKLNDVKGKLHNKTKELVEGGKRWAKKASKKIGEFTVDAKHKIASLSKTQVTKIKYAVKNAERFASYKLQHMFDEAKMAWRVLETTVKSKIDFDQIVGLLVEVLVGQTTDLSIDGCRDTCGESINMFVETVAGNSLIFSGLEGGISDLACPPLCEGALAKVQDQLEIDDDEDDGEYYDEEEDGENYEDDNDGENYDDEDDNEASTKTGEITDDAENTIVTLSKIQVFKIKYAIKSATLFSSPKLQNMFDEAKTTWGALETLARSKVDFDQMVGLMVELLVGETTDLSIDECQDTCGESFDMLLGTVAINSQVFSILGDKASDLACPPLCEGALAKIQDQLEMYDDVGDGDENS